MNDNETFADIRKDAETKFRELVEAYIQRRSSFQTTMGAMQAFNNVFDRLEAAHKRERQMIIDEANDDTALVKNCATCKHYCRNKKYCPAQDTVNVNPDILPIFRTGPCDKWKCKYTKK